MPGRDREGVVGPRDLPLVVASIPRFPILRLRMLLPFDPDEATAALRQSDPLLADLIDRAGPYTVEPKGDEPFVALVRSIVYQQLSGKAAGTIHGRVLALFEEEKPTPEALLVLEEETLRGAGLSRNKLAALRDLATKTLDGTVPSLDALHGMDDDEIIERLVAVRGVGPWTAQMLLMFNLGRPDVLPVDDLGVRHGFKLLHGHDEMPAPKALLEHGERWRPWRSVTSWYLWRAVDLHRQS